MAEWRIDDLARAAGTTVRNVRVYQDRGLLDPPERRGRVAVYTDEHLDRLRLILRLLSRGYPFSAIRELLDAWRGHKGLDIILGLDEAVHRPFTDEKPERLSTDDIARMFPGKGAWLRRALKAGVLERDGDGFVTRAPGLVRAGARLVAEGMPTEDAWTVGVAIWEATDRLAGLMTDAFVEHFWSPFKAKGMPEGEWHRIVRAIDAGREAALVGVMSALGAALRRSTDETLAQLGEPLELPTHGRNESTKSSARPSRRRVQR